MNPLAPRSTLINRTTVHSMDEEPHVVSVIAMDRSGSMGRFGNAPRDALAAHLATLRASPRSEAMSLLMASFADDWRIDLPHSALGAVVMPTAPVTAGMTRLYGTVRDMLTQLLAEVRDFPADRAPRLAIAVFTDGENSVGTKDGSDMADLAAVRGLAVDAQLLGCQLMLVGIGVDARRIARSMNFPVDLALRVAATEAGISSSMASISRTTLSSCFVGLPRDSTRNRN